MFEASASTNVLNLYPVFAHLLLVLKGTFMLSTYWPKYCFPDFKFSGFDINLCRSMIAMSDVSFVCQFIGLCYNIDSLKLFISDYCQNDPVNIG